LLTGVVNRRSDLSVSKRFCEIPSDIWKFFLALIIRLNNYLLLFDRYHIGVLRRRERNNNNINRNNNAGDAAAFAAVQQIQRMMDAAVERDNNDPQAANEPGAVPAAGPVAGQDAVDAPAVPAAPASAANPDAADVSAEAVAVEPPNANNSVISVVRTFVVTFFTSLLPEAPAL